MAWTASSPVSLGPVMTEQLRDDPKLSRVPPPVSMWPPSGLPGKFPGELPGELPPGPPC